MDYKTQQGIQTVGSALVKYLLITFLLFVAVIQAPFYVDFFALSHAIKATKLHSDGLTWCAKTV